MAVLDVAARVWRDALNIEVGQEPAALILEGTWWRAAAEKSRLALLDNVRETAFPDIYIGQWQGVRVAYCCAYGAARAVEPAHIFAQMGTPLLIQLGTCGAFIPDARPGSVMLPEICAARDGVSQHYGCGPDIELDPVWIDRAERLLAKENLQTLRGRHLTWPSLFAQSDEMCRQWAEEGLLTVDMETSVVGAVAQKFGVSAVSLLSVWDALSEGKTFLDPLPPEHAAELSRANTRIFDVALQLAKEVALRRAA
ncbi:hypothetical protein PSQ90_02125 [Devosia rhodophyticola]|uniref:Uridine phosphorylase n=1 Tax=Devosia rhodophyticola TaxID=3026423 RepID=A0ABY7YY43_9HYPH|nr:hypothetical protein [Devosia rhodophyticola]WDR06284.1 hypothetical protein PSQ90_02125 [Devosia rhodophyticola]